MVSHGFWQRALGGDEDAVGRTVRIGGHVYTVVGVAAEGFGGATFVPAELWTPMTWVADVTPIGISEGVPSPGDTPLERRGDRWLFLKGRLADRSTLEIARTRLEAVMEDLAAEHPDTNRGRRFSALAAGDVRFHPSVDGVIVPAGAGVGIVVALVLLVVIANVSGMLLARATTRHREVAIRRAIGASRGRVVRQFLTESALLSVAGGGGAMLLLWLWILGREPVALNVGIPITVESSLGVPAVWFGVGLSLLTGVVAGLAPALRATDAKQVAGLKDQRGLAQLRHSRWSLRDGLIVLQTAAALVLLVVSGLVTRSIVRANHIDVGFRADGVAAVQTGTSILGYDVGRAAAFYERALVRIRALPEVEHVALASRAPLDVSFSPQLTWLPDRRGPGDQGVSINIVTVSPEYFDTLGVPLLEGRHFTSAETAGTPRVAIVNRAMAGTYWPGESAIGKRFRAVSPGGPEYEIVGVSADYNVRSVGEAPTPYIHYARSQRPSTGWVILVAAREGLPVPIDGIRREVTALEPDALFEADPMQAKVDFLLYPRRAVAYTLSLVGLVTMVFAGVGLYGVIAFMVARRTPEFGVRIALGARPQQLFAFVLRRGVVITGIGALVGGVLGVVAAGALSSLLYGVSPADPLVWAAALVTVLGTSALAHAIPARRAASVNPVDALRAE